MNMFLEVKVVFENLTVRHKKFGLGVILSKQGKYMVISFPECTKNFVYPDAFEKFLTLEDGSVPEQILVDIEVSKGIKAQIEEEKNNERIHSMTHGIVIPGKEMSNEGDDEDNHLKVSDVEEF